MALADPELVAFTTDYLRALLARDEEHVAAHGADDPEAPYSALASLPGPRLNLAETIEHIADYPPVGLSRSRPEGAIVGDVAWMVDEAVCATPSGEEVPIRATFVLRRVDGAWKVVHWHVSEAVVHEL